MLGVTLDHKLNFNKHIANVCQMNNRKMFSIKRLFQLSFSVKLQFFKTFVLPYFDYCGTLAIYLTKTVLTKLCNSYYFCLFKLFNFSFGSNANICEINKFLAKYNIHSFQCRLFIRIASFVHKIYFTQAPSNLYDEIAICAHPPKSRCTRSARPLLLVPHFNLVSCGDRSFQSFSTKFINEYFINASQQLNIFKSNILFHFDKLFTRFAEIFVQFEITSKTFFKFKKC